MGKKSKSETLVTIEGTVTPCTEYARGETYTVPYDEHIQRLINGGHVAIVPDELPGEGEVLVVDEDSDVEQQAVEDLPSSVEATNG